MAKARYDCFKGAWFRIDTRRQDGRGFVVDDEALIGDFLKWQGETARYAEYTALSGGGRWIGFMLEDDVAAAEAWLKKRIHG